MEHNCGARSKQAGEPCKNPGLENGRCRFHGGLSTGPKTEAGKEASRKNGKLGGRPRKAATVPREPEPIIPEPATLRRCGDCAHLSAANTCMIGSASKRPGLHACTAFAPGEASVIWG